MSSIRSEVIFRPKDLFLVADLLFKAAAAARSGAWAPIGSPIAGYRGAGVAAAAVVALDAVVHDAVVVAAVVVAAEVVDAVVVSAKHQRSPDSSRPGFFSANNFFLRHRDSSEGRF